MGNRMEKQTDPRVVLLALIEARDNHAENPNDTPEWVRAGYESFRDWAADIAEAALKALDAASI